MEERVKKGGGDETAGGEREEEEGERERERERERARAHRDVQQDGHQGQKEKQQREGVAHIDGCRVGMRVQVCVLEDARWTSRNEVYRVHAADGAVGGRVRTKTEKRRRVES